MEKGKRKSTNWWESVLLLWDEGKTIDSAALLVIMNMANKEDGLEAIKEDKKFQAIREMKNALEKFPDVFDIVENGFEKKEPGARGVAAKSYLFTLKSKEAAKALIAPQGFGWKKSGPTEAALEKLKKMYSPASTTVSETVEEKPKTEVIKDEASDKDVLRRVFCCVRSATRHAGGGEIPLSICTKVNKLKFDANQLMVVEWIERVQQKYGLDIPASFYDWFVNVPWRHVLRF